mgnify:CR=1 FL=1
MPGSSAPGPATTSGGTEAGNPSKDDGCPEVSRSGSMDRREDFQEDPSHSNGVLTFATIPDGRALGSREPQDRIPMTGDPWFFQEEARQWRPSEYPVGTNKKVGRRGSLRGSNPRHSAGRPERSAEDPQRNPRGCRHAGPERSAKETQTPKPTHV